MGFGLRFEAPSFWLDGLSESCFLRSLRSGPHKLSQARIENLAVLWWQKHRKQTNMKRKKRDLSAEFKARIASEALKGIRSLNDIAQENEVAPSQVSQWKKELETRMVELFEGSNTTKKEWKKLAHKEAQMERKVGQLVLEKDFLLKKCEQLGIDVSVKP